MKNTLLKPLAVLMLFAICSCSKSDSESDCSSGQQYTVQGHIIIATTGKPLGSLPLSLVVSSYTQSGSVPTSNTYNSQTDSTGYFSFTYRCQQGIEAVELSICSDYYCGSTISPGAYYILESLNNIDTTAGPGFTYQPDRNINSTLYAVKNGWLKIYLNTNTPLKPNDTLYIQFAFPSYGNIIRSYALTQPLTGLLDSFYLHSGCYSLLWGRGGGYTRLGNPAGNISIKGAPYITYYTIKY